MMSLLKIFINFYFITLPFISLGQINIDRIIPKDVFTEIQSTQTTFNDKTHKSIMFSTVIPKKIIIEELASLYEDIGNLEKEKKIYKTTIKTKGESLSLITFISKKNKQTSIYITDEKDLENEPTINNLLLTFKKVLMRRFLNDYIIKLEKNISKIDRKQNKIIRNNPNNLMMNSGFFYKVYQANRPEKFVQNISKSSNYTDSHYRELTVFFTDELRSGFTQD